MDLVDALKARMGDETQVAFAARLGIDQSMLSKVLDRKANIGAKVAGAILRVYPDLRDSVVETLARNAGDPTTASAA